MPDVRREPFFRFSLMVARAAKDEIQPRKTMTWSALDGKPKGGDESIDQSGRALRFSHDQSPWQRTVPPRANEFTSFLKSYIATWAGRAGVLSGRE
jgi:hypothetical protein